MKLLCGLLNRNGISFSSFVSLKVKRFKFRWLYTVSLWFKTFATW